MRSVRLTQGEFLNALSAAGGECQNGLPLGRDSVRSELRAARLGECRWEPGADWSWADWIPC
ncbi:hypothetical protein chiPu_0032700, partial [Chiloscyllium punctatum]|nr:hypothetical protein [Chiloscyllium punctatum]